MPRVLHDPNFTFQDARQISGVVDLQVFRHWDETIVVVVSELIHGDGSGANSGASATDGIAAIATMVFNELGFDFDYLIEHYPAHGALLDLARSNAQQREVHEQFYIISLVWNDGARRYEINPHADTWAWKQISRADAEKIIGEPFILGPAG